MNTSKFYIPILKWKKGEQIALKNLTNKQKENITPLIEVIDPSDTNVILTQIKESFNRNVYIDTLYAADEDRAIMLELVENNKDYDFIIIPVLYHDDFPVSFSKKIDHIAIRIPVPEDLEGPTYQDFFDTIDQFKNTHPNKTIDIILDLEIVADRNTANIKLSELKTLCTNHILNREDNFKNIVISLSSFPDDISSIGAGGCATYKRFDFKIFEKIYREPKFEKIKNKLIYSDYGVSKFTDSEIDFRKMRYGILPKIKYTTFQNYQVLKGSKDHVRKVFTKNYFDLALEIYNSNYYFGSNFSFGDLEIEKRALKQQGIGPGGSKEWVAFTANHHIAVVIEQLSNLP